VLSLQDLTLSTDSITKFFNWSLLSQKITKTKREILFGQVLKDALIQPNLILQMKITFFMFNLVLILSQELLESVMFRIRTRSDNSLKKSKYLSLRQDRTLKSKLMLKNQKKSKSNKKTTHHLMILSSLTNLEANLM